MRDENSSLWKQNGQYAQKLVSMSEQLRISELAAREEAERARMTADEASLLRRRVDQHNELMTEKDRAAEVRLRILLSFLKPFD